MTPHSFAFIFRGWWWIMLRCSHPKSVINEGHLVRINTVRDISFSSPPLPRRKGDGESRARYLKWMELHLKIAPRQACQLRYILLYYSTWDPHWKINNLVYVLRRGVVCTRWQRRTLRTSAVMWRERTLFFLIISSHMACMKPSQTFLPSCPFRSDTADTLSNLTIIHSVEKD